MKLEKPGINFGKTSGNPDYNLIFFKLKIFNIIIVLNFSLKV